MIHRWWLSLSLPGVVGATTCAALAFTPSLLPRDWALQGLVEGLSAGCGYAAAVFVAWVVRGLVGRSPSTDSVRRMRIVVSVGAPIVLTFALWRGFQWQVEIHRMMGHAEPGRLDWIPLSLLATAVLVLMVALGRAVLRFYRVVHVRLAPRLPHRIVGPVAALLVVVVLIGVNDGLVWRLAVNAANAAAGRVNSTTLDGLAQPQWPQVSGSPMSLITWDSLGKQGRTFVATAPTTSELTRFSGAVSRRPIRVYAGLRSASDPERRAALAVRDLVRAGGFHRDVIVVAATTGTGWIDPGAIRAVEYMHNGNTAVVAMQYSYLWSALSFIVDGEKARAAGAALFNAVYDRWRAMPAKQRPRLVVTGTSLGAAGAEGAFSGLADMQLRTDGVVIAGAPVFAQLHATLVQRRDAGSLQRKPVYRDGRVVRFGDRASDWTRNAARWGRPRVLYLQNGSDPIVVWSPSLAIGRPDWMEEALPDDVLPAMRWIPFVTFWQVSADLPFSMHSGGTHGHNYRGVFPAAWAAVAPPTGWTDDDTARLTALLG